jgi:peptidoglycan/xylan/chitin deacetylase (PgdA/CDA1 family)/glycosyltransferase involved in cell wall biosynthesis
MVVSVVIATYNRRELLKRTLPPLLNQDFPRDNYEVIVVVDGSTDATSEFLSGLGSCKNLRVIEQENRGQAAAINAGLSAARGDLVMFLDDDILCGPTLVAEHAKAERAGNNCLVYGPVMVSPEGPDSLAIDWARSFCDDFFETKVLASPEEGWYGCMASANSSAPRSVILSIGGMDESFSRGNDVELGFRLRNAGFSFSYQPSALTHQIFQKTRRNVIEDAAGEGSAEIRLCRKYPALRHTSRFAMIASRPLWKRSLTRALATAPISVEPLLRPLTWALAKFRTVPAFRRAALRLFQVQQNIAAYRSAVKEAGSWQAIRREFGARLPILMYHGIGPMRDGTDPFLTISPQMFESQLQWLSRNGFSTISLADWVEHQRSGKALPDKPILLTFDDGYSDTAEFGFPLLQKYGFTGTLFLVTDYIGKTNAWDLHLGVSEQPLMTADQIRYWADLGIEMGSHTRTHPDLRTLTPELISREMKESREHLEELLGSPVTAFAYPYGYFNDQTAEIARGFFESAVTCDIGVNNMMTDRMRLRRAIVVPRYTPFAMRGSVLFGFNVLLISRIQLSLLAHKLIDRKIRRQTKDKRQAKGTISK